MFHLELKPLSEPMIALIPSHREYVNRAFAEGRMLSYSVSLQREHVWCVINAEDESEAMGIVAGFPLSPYFADVVSVPLLFHNTLPAALPGISLN